MSCYLWNEVDLPKDLMGDLSVQWPMPSFWLKKVGISQSFRMSYKGANMTCHAGSMAKSHGNSVLGRP